MPAEPVRDVLARLPHFRGLAPAVLDAVLATATSLTLQAGEILFREGDPCDGFFVVAQGHIKVFRLTSEGREQVVHDIPAGRTFAEAALFHHGRYPVWGSALKSPTVVIKLNGPAFLALFASEPELAGSMVGSLCNWLHTLLERIETLSLVSAGARLAHHLLRLPAASEGEHLVVTLELPKKDLASELSITPETLSRLLARWRDRGWASVDGAHVTLRDLHALQALADSSAPA